MERNWIKKMFKGNIKDFHFCFFYECKDLIVFLNWILWIKMQTWINYMYESNSYLNNCMPLFQEKWGYPRLDWGWIMESQTIIWFGVSSRHPWEDASDWSNVCTSSNEYDYNRMHDDILQVCIKNMTHTIQSCISRETICE